MPCAGPAKPYQNGDIVPPTAARQRTSPVGRVGWPASVAALALALIVPAHGLHAGAASQDLAATAVIDVGDAYIRETTGGHQWTLGNNEIAAGIVVTKIGILVESLTRPGSRNLIVPAIGDVAFTYDGIRTIVGDRTWRYDSATATNDEGRAELTLAFTLRDRPLKVQRHFAVAPGVPVLETWTTVTADRDVTVNDAAAFSFEFVTRDLGWQTGLETPDAAGGPFSARSQRMNDGARSVFGSETLSSRSALPWFTLTGDGDRVTVALAWSGTWQADVQGTAAGTLVDLGLPNSAVVVRQGRTQDFPHGLIGLTADTAGEEGRAFAGWLASRRGGRPFPALATYNSWFQYGIEINDSLMRQEIDEYAALGGELFELDAGWYPPLNAENRFDFTAGLGSWQIDRTRFPGGLGTLTNYAHARGLRFGLWAEPERVDLATVNRGTGAQTRFLAQQNGQYQAGVANANAKWAQICLAEEEGWTWVRDRLFAFLDDGHPDYLKIDMNGWATCTRADHEHGAGGGNFGHVQGFYRLLAALRERYPALIIENVGGGARRLDPEVLVRTDAMWVDDITAPSSRVRHHNQLLSQFVPPSALLAYVAGDATEPLAGTPDMGRLARSRMPGVMGLSASLHQLPQGDTDDLARYIGEYKTLRNIRGQGYAALLTAPVNIDGSGPGWDVVQHTNPLSGIVTVYGFRNASGDRRVSVRLAGLRSATTYRYWSFEDGTLGRATGAALMTNGLPLDGSTRTASVIVVEPQ